MTFDLKSFYSGKRVLITGHTGFKGSWLSIWLNALGADVAGYALDPLTERDNFVLSNIGNAVMDIRGDVRDKMHLKAVFNDFKPEIVFHLAAQPLVKASYDDAVGTYETNVLGTMNVLEGIRSTEQTRAGVMITTDKCYENREWVWGYRENDALGGHDPYSSSKACAELLCSSYQKSFFNVLGHEAGKNICTARAGNVIGGGDWAADRIIPDCIRALSQGNEILIRNPLATRPWQHVLEPLQGYMMLGVGLYMDGNRYIGSWNFGPDPESMISVETVVKKVINAWGSGTYRISDEKQGFHETKMLFLDTSKSRNGLQWAPKWNIDETIRYTVDWYRDYPLRDVAELCLHQIDLYTMKG